MVFDGEVCSVENIRSGIVIASEAKQSQMFRRLFLSVGQEIATALRASQ